MSQIATRSIGYLGIRKVDKSVFSIHFGSGQGGDRGAGQGSGQGGDRGAGQGSGLAGGRGVGRVSGQAGDWQFSNQGISTRVIGTNLMAIVWSGPWESWRDVPNEDKMRFFERFQWEEEWNAQIYRKAAIIAGRELSHREMWKQSHCRKGSRPLDNLSNLLVEDVDLEGDIQEENLNWVDDRAPKTLAKYEGYLVKKYGKEHSLTENCGHELPGARKAKCTG
ncbi:hypothetical protein L1987_71073 [Smallanthus sonchifolius]|uniref:Uncharacterized protein n=1 Tax=Smallanthus sonchifolius TaxID=185202 RepID=A0ACB9ASA4_9ASTR|nr:hypothetical protein L1987_71073 [Smallanthus sonchifolius]